MLTHANTSSVRRACCLLLLALLWPGAASASSFHVHTSAASEATQWRRLDLGVVASRPLLFGMDLGAYDLLSDQTGSLNARFSMRYANDFGLPQQLQDSPRFATQSNDLRVNLLYIQWTPSPLFSMTLGRQWSINALGMRDFDGIHLALSSPRSSTLSLRLGAYGGQDVQAAWGARTPDSFDVQGIPLEARSLRTSAALIAGTDLSLQLTRKMRLAASYQRRWRDDDPGHATTWHTGDEQVGASALVSPTPHINLSAQAAYHTLLGQLTQAGVQASSALPHDLSLSLGAGRRRPWFDSASIFNIFGANPHDELWGALNLPAQRLHTTFQVRGWLRSFYPQADPGEQLGALRDGERSVGGALAHHTRVAFGRRSLRADSTLSLQVSPPHTGGTQWLADTRARLPLIPAQLGMSARLIGLRVVHDHPRYGNEHALSAILGVDTPVLQRGKLSVLLEQRLSTNEITSTNIYGVLELEVWR